MTWADKILTYMGELGYPNLVLPDDIGVMNPYVDSDSIKAIAKQFYKKYYDDNSPRHLILGINPGRLGAGATGLPFTDTKRLEAFCDIKVKGLHTHEPSSVYVYDVIMAMGGPEVFYKDFYISSVFPLGFTKLNNGKEINYNYYDSKALEVAITPYALAHIRDQIAMGCVQDRVFCLGTGKNYKYLKSLNDQHSLFGEVVPLEHPRYIMQYKLKLKENYILAYMNALGNV